MAYSLSPEGLDCTGIQVLEKLKFRECPDGSGEVVVAVKLCDDADIEIDVGVSPELPPGWSVLCEFGSASSIITDTETTLITYTVPVGKLLVLKSIEASGENRAKYTVEVDTIVKAIRRSYEPIFNVDFDFDKVQFVAGQIIKVKAEHSRPQVSDHETRILGYLKDV